MYNPFMVTDYIGQERQPLPPGWQGLGNKGGPKGPSQYGSPASNEPPMQMNPFQGAGISPQYISPAFGGSPMQMNPFQGVGISPLTFLAGLSGAFSPFGGSKFGQPSYGGGGKGGFPMMQQNYYRR